MANVEWVKLTTDMFDNRKIKYIRTLPEGNNIVLIWVMLLTMAGRCNASGMIFLTENIPYTSAMLADELKFDISVVELALGILQKMNMIVVDNQYFAISGWEEYQNIEGMEKIREQNRIRKAKQRENQKMIESRDSHVTVTLCHATDIENKNKNIDIDNSICAEAHPKQPSKRFSIPSIEDVKNHCKEHGYTFDAETFWHYYNGQGWKLSNGRPMASWESCCVTWQKKENEHPNFMKNSKPSPAAFSGEKSFDADDFLKAALNREKG